MRPSVCVCLASSERQKGQQMLAAALLVEIGKFVISYHMGTRYGADTLTNTSKPTERPRCRRPSGSARPQLLARSPRHAIRPQYRRSTV